MGGNGSQLPSPLRIPKTNSPFFPLPLRGKSVFHIADMQSSAHNQDLGTTSLITKSMSSMLLPIGPATAWTPHLVMPSAEIIACPPDGTLPLLDLTPKIPLHIVGTLILPPVSAPHPIIEPFMATMTPSPPELPPAVHNLLIGFITRPKTLLTAVKRVECLRNISLRDDHASQRQ